MLRLRFVPVVLASVVAASSAHADERPPPRDPTSANAAELAATIDVVSVQQAGGYQPYYGFQLAALYRASPRLSLGAVGSHAISRDFNRLSRVMGEAVFHALRTRFVDAWGAAELGFAFSKLAPPVACFFADGDGSSCVDYGAQKRTRIAPSAGVGAGIDLLPISYVSLGLEARALGVVFDDAPGPSSPNEANATRELPGGPTLTLYAGATLAVRAPLP